MGTFRITVGIADPRGQHFEAVEPESGDYEIADQAIVASQRLRERHPEVLFFTIKIGYKASISFGGHRLPEEDC